MMTPEDWINLVAIVGEFLVTISGVGVLVYYRLKKKHKDDRKTRFGVWSGFYNLIEKNIVEITLFGILVPDWTLIVKLFN